MNSNPAVWLLGLAVAAILAVQAEGAPFTLETDSELSTSLDADGDGTLDLLVVDKSTGLRRLGLQQPGGQYVWQEPQSAGVHTVDALSAGRFDSILPMDGFAIASAEDNRALAFPSSDSEGVLIPSFGIAPNSVVAIDWLGTAVDEIVVATLWDDPPDATHLAAFQWQGGTLLSFVPPTAASGPWSQVNRCRFRPDRSWSLAGIRPSNNGTAELFTQLYFQGAGLVTGPTLTGLDPQTRWAWGEFQSQSNTISTFILYHSGGSELQIPGIAEPFPQTFEFTTGTRYNLGVKIELVAVLPSVNGAMLFIITQDGATARVYDFNGVSAPVLRQTMNASPSLRFTLGSGLGNGAFAALLGDKNGSGRSSSWQRWTQNGAQHVLASSGQIPTILPTSGRANVLLFDGDPVAFPNAPLLRSVKLGGWSVQASFQAGLLQVQQQPFVDASHGLGASSALQKNLILTPLDAVVPWVNQQGPASSLAIADPPTTAGLAQITFSPAAGTYAASADSPLEIRLLSSPDAPILFRSNTTLPWSLYDPTHPPQISSTTEFTAFAQLTPPSAIQHARYIIQPHPLLGPVDPVDADHNGLPDGYEQALGLHGPNDDPDGDGYTNLQEYQAGTDPQDPGSIPSPDLSQVQLVARSPRPDAPDGTFCEIAWRTGIPGLILETTADLAPPVVWTPVSGVVNQIAGENVYEVPVSSPFPQLFFRLRKGP